MDLAAPVATHIIKQFASRQITEQVVGTMEDLYRASDGMLIGSRVHCQVQWGEDPPTRKIRNFISENFAMEYLRTVAEMDLADTGRQAIFDVQDAEPKLTVPMGAEISKYARQ